MTDRQDDLVDPRLEATVRRALAASARDLPPSSPRVAAVLRAGRRRHRARRAATGTAVAAVAAAVAALWVTVPTPRGDAPPTGQAAAGASARPSAAATTSPPASAGTSLSASAPGPVVLRLGSGRLDGIDWDARVSLDGRHVCQHLTIGGAQVDAPAGYWTDCSPAHEARPDGEVGVHIAGASGLRLVTAFGVDTVARMVVTFADGTSAQGAAVRLPGSGAEGAVVPVPPGQRISTIDFYDAHGARVGHDTGYA
jgi:hypothetical protein